MKSESSQSTYRDLFARLGLGVVLLGFACFWATGGNIGYHGRIFLNAATQPLIFWGTVILVLLSGLALVICNLFGICSRRRWEREYEQEIVDACRRQRRNSDLDRDTGDNRLFF